MKNRLTNFFLTYSVLLSIPLSFAQDIMWEKSFGGRHAEYLADVQPTLDYGFILGGSSLSKKSGNKNEDNNGVFDYWIWKMDENGEPEWQKTFGGSKSDVLKCIKTTRDGGFILAGTSSSSIGFDKKEDCRGGNDYWIIKLDAGREVVWQRTFGGKGQDDLSSIICTSDGGYLIGGSSNSNFSIETNTINDKKENSRGNMDFWIVKLDSSGQEEWQKTYGGQHTDLLKSVVLSKDGGYILGGYSNSGNTGEKSQPNFGTGGDYWIIKIDDKGAIVWEKTIGGDKDDQLEVILSTYDGGYIIGGSSISSSSFSKNPTNGNGIDFWIIKLKDDGDIDWQKTYDFGSNDILTSLTQNTDQSYLIGGYTVTKNGEESGDYIALKIDATGEKIWDYAIGSVGEDILKKLIETRDGGYLMAGTANPESTFKERKINNRNNKISSNPLNTEKQLAVVDKAQNEINDKIKDFSSKVNETLLEQITTTSDKINDKIPIPEDSNLKLGLNKATGNPLNTSRKQSSDVTLKQAIENAMEAKGPKPGTKYSREKKMNFGNKDYWVVKIKDKDKKVKEKLKLEAAPNPTLSYTNVVIGFDFETGSATIYDLSGRQLQHFKIDTRTVPVNLTSLPTGIYVINIKTNKGEGSVKIIKQ